MSSNLKRLLIGAVVAVLFGAYFVFDLGHFLSFETLRQGQAEFAQMRDESPWLVTGGFFVLYVAVTALSLPGAAVMTIAAGALFGLLTGVILVSFASSIGATLAFLVSRHLLRDWVQTRFADKLGAINRGIEREGGFYLFTLRLVPLFPFFLINLVMGLTPMRARTFYWVSQLGMLAGTVVYVNAGTQLAAIDSPAGILSPALIVSFALLGIFPLIARRIVEAIRKRRVYRGWTRPARFDRNLVVIGGGAAGLVSAYIAAAVKAKVTLIEAHKMGGDCLNTGCVPSKALIRSAKLAHQIRHAHLFGLEAGAPVFSFREIMARVRDKIRAIEPHDSVARYTGLGVEVLKGYARIVDPWTVEVTLDDGEIRCLRTRSIIVATGAKPNVPPIPGLEQVDYLTSDTVWDALSTLDAPPARLVLVGGGPIGCELAQAMARLGSKVTLLQRGKRLMPREDDEVSEFVRQALIASGVEVLTSHDILRCEHAGAGTHSREGTGEDEHPRIVVRAAGTGSQQERRIPFDALLLAVGREARLEGFGLQTLGIPTSSTVDTNGYLETIFPNIYAAGDVAGPYQFTHTAAHMAWYASVNALFGTFKRFQVDYSVIPWTTFIDPEVARVGLNEREAREHGIPFEVTRYGLDDLDRAIADSADQGFVKVLTVPGKDRILGVTIVAEHAAELLAEFVLAMKHGLGLNKILGTIHTYPTMSEANKYVAGEWKRAHAPQRVLEWVGRFHAWRLG